jgi:hypothetical protein
MKTKHFFYLQPVHIKYSVYLFLSIRHNTGIIPKSVWHAGESRAIARAEQDRYKYRQGKATTELKHVGEGTRARSSKLQGCKNESQESESSDDMKTVSELDGVTGRVV